MHNASLFKKIIKKEFKCDCISEYKFHEKRRWRADFAILEHKILIEVEGGIWVRGRHNRASGYIKDMEKYNTATSMGFRVLRFQPSDLLKTETLDLIKKTIENGKLD